MKECLILKQKSVNGKLYYYAFNDMLKRYQRIKRDVFADWFISYYGIGKQSIEISEKSENQVVFKIIKQTK